MAITTETAPRVPLLRSTPIIGAASEMRRDFLATTLRAAREVGDIARIVAGPPGWRITLYSVSTPELVFEILGHPDRFTKDVPSYRELRWALGNGMLTSEGEDWHRQRRFLAPFFTPKRIATSYAPVMAEEATKWVERHRAAAAGGLTVDAHAEMIDLTSRIIGRILFGAEMTPPSLRSRSSSQSTTSSSAAGWHHMPCRCGSPPGRTADWLTAWPNSATS